MKSAPILMLCGCVLLADGPAYSEDEPEVDCANAVTQYDMNVCADRDYKAADKELNLQWVKTRKVVAEWDADLDEQAKGAVASLLKAQRAWIEYRDGQCNAAGYAVWGGSMYPMVVASCLTDLTRKRTEELKDLANGAE